MKRYIMIVAAVVVLAALSPLGVASAAPGYDVYGLELGASRDAVTEKLGQPRAEIDRLVAGQIVGYYLYKDFQIGFAADTQAVVDMLIIGRGYKDDGHVVLGDTTRKIFKLYGKSGKQRINKRTCFVYGDGETKIIFDVTAGYVEAIRLTNLEIITADGQ